MHRKHFKQPRPNKAELICNNLDSFKAGRYFLADFFISSRLLRLNYLLSVPQTITVDHLMLHAPFCQTSEKSFKKAPHLQNRLLRSITLVGFGRFHQKAFTFTTSLQVQFIWLKVSLTQDYTARLQGSSLVPKDAINLSITAAPLPRSQRAASACPHPQTVSGTIASTYCAADTVSSTRLSQWPKTVPDDYHPC